MTSSSDHILRRAPVSARRYRIGEAARGVADPLDPRPYSVREAEAQHQQTVTRLKERQQAALEEAYRNGYHDGVAMAKSDAAAQLQRLGRWLESLADDFGRTRAVWFDACEEQAVALVGRALEHILGDRPPVADRVRHALRKAFEQLSADDQVTVHCHPDDLEFVKGIFARRAEVFAGHRRVRILPDEQVGVNGCLVETELGIVDARVEKQLAILKGVLLDCAPTVDKTGSTLAPAEHETCST